MIAFDTSVWIEFFRNGGAREVQTLVLALHDGALVLPPPVMMELTSSPILGIEEKRMIKHIPMIEHDFGYWIRAGELRATLLKSKVKAKPIDCLIAQSCIDSKIPLVTLDKDFRHFTKLGLRLR